MSVRVKVLCQLSVFLVALLVPSIAKRSTESDFADSFHRGNQDPDRFYSEFTDDIIFHGEEFDERPPKYYEREKRDTWRNNKDYSEDLELVDEKKKYQKEQYWNEGDVEVEEELPEGLEVVPKRGSEENRNYYDTEESEEIPRNRRIRDENKRDERYENKYNINDRVYDSSESSYEEPRERRKRDTKSKKTYEVHETEEEEDPMMAYAETRYHKTVQQLPESLNYQGVQYVRAPRQDAPATTSYYVRHDGPAVPMEHYHRVPGKESSPPAGRYTQAASGMSLHVQAVPAGSHPQEEVASSDHKETSKHSKKTKSGGGGNHKDSKHSEHGEEAEKGYKSSHHHQKGAKGSEGSEKRAKHYDEQEGKQHQEHEEGGHRGEHHEAAHGSKGAKFDEKKKHDRGHATKGYHNKYHKDESHKEHKFYDDYHKSGSHSRYGKSNANHAANSSSSKKGKHNKQGKHADHHGKKGQYAKGYESGDHKGYKNKKGYQKHHQHSSDYGKKGGHQGGKAYGYKH